MNRERLELMVTMLEEIENGTWKPTAGSGVCEYFGLREPGDRPKFDLGVWISTEEDCPTCGTVACAMGHACLDKRFTDLGLYLHPNIAAPAVDLPDSEFGEIGFAATAIFFGISSSSAQDLFAPQRYASKQSPEAVRGRITHMLHHGERP